MTGAADLSIEAYVDAAERPAIVAGCEQLCEALRDEAGRPWPVRLILASYDRPTGEPPAPIAIASPLADVWRLDRPMASIEAAWRDRLEGRLDARRRSVLLCTVFRAVADRNGPLVERIRRLNLLVADLSHDFDAPVIDIDRILSVFGAESLATDYRLGGQRAAEAAGHAVAASLLAGDLGGIVAADRRAVGAGRHGGLNQLAATVERRLRAREQGGGR